MAIRIPIITDFKNGDLKKAEREIARFADKATAQLKMMGVGAAVATGFAIKTFADFDDKMTQSLAIMGDVSADLRAEMETTAREVAKTTTFSAEQAAESYFFLASAGLDAAASISAMPQVASFAQAGMFDMARATDLLTDAQSALGLTVRDDAQANLLNMARVSDTLVKANTLANASVEQFSTALTTKAGPAMRAVGMDVEEGVAVLAAFADQGIKSELAGTNFAIVLRDLQTKAIENKDAFSELGVTVFDSSGEMVNMADIVADLETATAGMSDEQRKATFGMLGFADKSMGALAALLGTSDAIRGYESELRKANGTTQEIAQKQLVSFSSQLKLLLSQIQDVAIEVGQQLVPELKQMVQFLNTDEGRKKMQQLATTLAEVAKAAANIVGFLADNITKLDDLLIAVGAVRIAWGVLVAAVAIYNAATLGAVAVTNALKLAIASTGIGLAVIALGTLVGGMIAAGDNADAAIKPTDDYRLKLLELENQAKNTNYALDGLTAGGFIPASPTAESKTRPLNPKPGEVYTFYSIDRETDQPVWYTQTWNGTEWTKPQKMTYTPPSTGGSGKSAAEKLADARQELLTEVSAYNKNLTSLSRLSDKILSEYQQDVADALGKVRDTITKALDDDVITKRGARALNRLADFTGKALNKIAGMRTDLASQYNALTQKLADATSLRQTTAEDIRSLANLAELSRLTQETVDATGKTIETTSYSSAQLISNLRSVVEGVKNFRDNMSKLKDLGLDPELYGQIIQSGMEAGGATAEALIAGGPEAVTEINKLFKEISDVGNEIGVSVSNVMYNGGESAIQGLIDGIKAQDDELARQAENIATIFFDALQGKIDGTVLDLDPILKQLKDLYKQIGITVDLPTGGGTAPVASNPQMQALSDKIAFAQKRLAEESEKLSRAKDKELRESITKKINSYTQQIADFTEQLAKLQASLGAAAGQLTANQLAGIVPNDASSLMGAMSVAPTSNKYTINVTANTRAGGAAAGEAIVESLKKYQINNGSVNNALVGFGS